MTHKEASYSLFKFAVTRDPVFFVVMQLIAVGGHPWSYFAGDWHWSWILVTVGVEVGFWVSMWYFRRKLRKINEKGPGSPHRDDVCEYCDPPCRVNEKGEMTGPLSDMEDWYMAAHHVDRERAQREIANAKLTGDIAVLSALHAKYLSHRDFKKFRK